MAVSPVQIKSIPKIPAEDYSHLCPGSTSWGVCGRDVTPADKGQVKTHSEMLTSYFKAGSLFIPHFICGPEWGKDPPAPNTLFSAASLGTFGQWTKVISCARIIPADPKPKYPRLTLSEVVEF